MAVNGGNNAAKEPPSMPLLYRRQMSEYFGVRPAFSTKEPKKAESFIMCEGTYNLAEDSGLFISA